MALFNGKFFSFYCFSFYFYFRGGACRAMS